MWLRMIALCLVSGAVWAAESVPGALEVATRRELAAAERSINQHFQPDLAEQAPVTMMGTTRGAYLEGFGAVFTMELNLWPTPNVSPFRRSYSDEQKKQLNERKRSRLPALEERIAAILIEQGPALESVPAKEQIALVITLFHFRWENLDGLPSQLVIQGERGEALAAASGRISKEEFRKQLKVRYF